MSEPLRAPGFLHADGPDGPVEYAATGAGDPVTLFVHGLTGSVAHTRPFGSGVPGRRVFPSLRGHGGTPVPATGAGGWDDVAAEVDAVRRATGATRALGISLGAGALLRLLVDAVRAGDDGDDGDDDDDGARLPLDRVVLALPAALDTAPAPDDAGRRRMLALADALDAGDAVRAAELLREQQPAAVRQLPAVGLWARRRAAEIAGSGLPAVLRAFAGSAPLAPAERALLGRVDVPALVLCQEADDAHPLDVAHDIAAALPAAELVVLPPGAVLWTGRDRLRDVLTGFFGASE